MVPTTISKRAVPGPFSAVFASFGSVVFRAVSDDLVVELSRGEIADACRLVAAIDVELRNRDAWDVTAGFTTPSYPKALVAWVMIGRRRGYDYGMARTIELVAEAGGMDAQSLFVDSVNVFVRDLAKRYERPRSAR